MKMIFMISHKHNPEWPHQTQQPTINSDCDISSVLIHGVTLFPGSYTQHWLCLPLSWCGRAPACAGVSVLRCVWKPEGGGDRRRTGWAPEDRDKSGRWPPGRYQSGSGSRTTPDKPDWDHRPSWNWGLGIDRKEWKEGERSFQSYFLVLLLLFHYSMKAKYTAMCLCWFWPQQLISTFFCMLS